MDGAGRMEALAVVVAVWGLRRRQRSTRGWEAAVVWGLPIGSPTGRVAHLTPIPLAQSFANRALHSVAAAVGAQHR